MSTTNVRDNGVATAQDAKGAVGGIETWNIDPAASRAEFAIGKRLMFVRRLTVPGTFSDVRGTISLDEKDPANSRADIAIGAATVDTRNARRDKHLRTADFFHVEQHPNLTFTSRRIEAVDRDAGRYRVTGDLTVRGVTREVSLDARYVPAQSGAREPRIKITITGALNRRDFGIVWSNPLFLPADDLTVTLTVEATRS